MIRPFGFLDEMAVRPIDFDYQLLEIIDFI